MIEQVDEHRDIEELHEQLEDAQRRLAAVRTSRSWRLTRPLRWLMALLRPEERALVGPVSSESVCEPVASSPEPVPVVAEPPTVVEALVAEASLHEDRKDVSLGALDVRLIAFYLPQFHPIPENDEFWGRGFTEWTNTTRARPLFAGHDQPRLPGELGFYDLRLEEVQRRQIELARSVGIHGFCYHYYWFNGRKVLDLPLQRVLEDPSLDFPFCINWANEAWTSAWDGVSRDGVLIPQHHSAEDDQAFLDGVAPLLADRRYVRVGGKPLLSIYRQGLFPDMRATLERWRERAVTLGLGELYLAVVQNVDDAIVDPREAGFDAAIEFPPANMECCDVSDQVERFTTGYPTNIYSYPEVVRHAVGRPVPDYTLLRGIMPGWDNTARRRDGTLYLGATPDLYGDWLDALCRYSKEHLPPSERLVFVNAWNEWAEGAYLEPDRTHGYAFLNRTGAVMGRHHPERRSRSLLVVGHDAGRAGAQILLLDLLRWLVQRTSTEVKILLGSGGDLVPNYQAVGEVRLIDELVEQAASGEDAKAHLRHWVGSDVDLIYANTAVAGKYFALLEGLDAPIVTHVHELEESLRLFAGTEATQQVVMQSELLIAASPAVEDNLVERHGVARSEVETVNAFIQPQALDRSPARVAEVRRELGIAEGDVVVFGCGSRDWRKGPDLFVEVAAELRSRGVDGFQFLWIGPEMRGHYPRLEQDVKDRGLSDCVRFLGLVENPSELFVAGDVFLLPSREDPFPLVCLEAAACEMPVVCFADVGGMPGFVEADAGHVVPKGDLEAMVQAVEGLILRPSEREDLGSVARQKLLRRHTTEVSAPRIFNRILEVSRTVPRVSVVVPNYNYAERLEARIGSILRQSYQDFEIVVHDDGSTDDSLRVLESYRRDGRLKLRAHAANRGTFGNWRRGITEARGDLIWMAEADDLCEETFLERLIPCFEDPAVRLAYSQSTVIDEHDNELGDYTLAFPDLSTTKWLGRYQQPLERELEDGLAVQNFLVNASSVIFRRPTPEQLASLPDDLQLAGDWYLYLLLLEGGDIAYVPERLNRHRRHDQSVLAGIDNERRVQEIGRVHRLVRSRFQVSEALNERMTRYALETWLQANPDGRTEDFRLHYGASIPASAG